MNKLKIRHDSNARRASLAELIPDWPTLQKIKRTAKVTKQKYNLVECLTELIIISFARWVFLN